MSVKNTSLKLDSKWYNTSTEIIDLLRGAGLVFPAEVDVEIVEDKIISLDIPQKSHRNEYRTPQQIIRTDAVGLALKYYELLGEKPTASKVINSAKEFAKYIEKGEVNE